MSASPAATPDPEWFRHFGLDRDPFAEGGVHGLFYPGGARQETVEQLLHLARYSDCVLLVTGVAGAGKSATRRHFVAQAAADTRCCVVEAALLDGPEQWLRRVLAGFGIHPAGRPDLAADLQLLADSCTGRSESGGRSWLVVDDAQDLHADVVAVFARLLQSTGRSLRVAFFAEPRWREVLQTALPAGVPLHTLELQPFDAGETHAYLHYRLNTAGLDGEPPYNPQEYERIHRESGGVPGRINAVARAVLEAAAHEVQQPLRSLPLWHFGVIAVTLLSLLLLYVWGSLDQDAPRSERAAARPVAGAPPGESVPEIQIAPAEPAPAGTGQAVLAPAPGVVHEPVSEVTLAGDAQTEAGPPAPAGQTNEAVTRSGIAGEVPEEHEDAGAAGSSVHAGAPALSPGPDTGAAATTAAATPSMPPPGVSAVAPEAAPAAGDTSVTAAGNAEYVYRSDGRAGGSPTADEQFLLALDPGHFVLQIMASDDGERVRAYAARSGLALRVYRKLNNGREWYALVQGEYPSRAAAEAALGELPPKLRDSRPWVRRLDAVQKEIRAARAI